LVALDITLGIQHAVVMGCLHHGCHIV
jgi:hypothetical protein